MTDAAALELEAAIAAQAEARLSQERTQRLIRRVALVTAALLVTLSASTLVYVVIVAGKATSAAEAAQTASAGNRDLLAALRTETVRRQAVEVEQRTAAAKRLRDALAELVRGREETDARRTAQLQLILDLLTAEVRDPANQENRPAPTLRPSPSSRPAPRASSTPGPRSGTSPSPRPSGKPSPKPSPQPSCVTGQPVLGICVPPP